MIHDARLSKVDILIQQKKYSQAEQVLKDLLSEDPNDARFLCLLAEVNLQQDKFEIADSIIDNAIGLDPGNPYLFYTKSRIAIQQDAYDKAEQYIYQAIGLDPYDADYFALLSNIQLGRKRFAEALENADKALEIDAENVYALNARSTALNKLNRKEESFETIQGALREDPNNAYTHTNYGWGLLEKGDHKKALEHFKEALSYDPSSGYAQAGMLEAIKASNPVYRLFLKYAFWMNNLTAKYQWAVIIGFYAGSKVLRAIADNNETLQPYLSPLIILLALIAFSTWVITPIGNLFLRFNKYGQLLLEKEEKMNSSLVAASMGVFLAGVLLYLALSDEKMLTIAVFGFAMMVPLSNVFSSSKKTNWLPAYAIALGIVGIIAIGLTLSTGEMFGIMSMIFVFGFVAYQWIANYLQIKAGNR